MSEGTTVIYIGNFRPDHSTETHIARALRFLGVHVVQVQEDECPWHDIASLARGRGAAFVLWTHTHDYASGPQMEAECFGMIEDCRRAGVRTVSYHLDRWWGLERQVQAETEPFFRTDLVCTADGGHDRQWSALGINHRWMPPAVSLGEAQRGHRDSRYVKDVGFVGSWQHYGHADVWPWRFQAVNHARLHYGSRFRAWPRGGPAIRGAELRDLYASVSVLLGDSCLAPAADGSPMTRYWSDRIPETLGRGGFLVHPDVVGLRDVFACELPWTFQVGDLAGMVATVDRALGLTDAERLALTDDARAEVVRSHTYEQRMCELFDAVDAL